MKQVFLQKPRQLVVIEVDIPDPGDEQVVIEIKACGVCSTDVHSFEGETIQGNRFPFHPGHEVAGVVHSIGRKCHTLKPGDTVVINPFFPCEQCEFCRNNLQNHCLNTKTIGLVGPGGFSDFTVVPERSAYRFEGIAFESAALAEPLATVVYGAERAGLGMGDRVLVQGVGPIGMLHLQVALAAGAQLVAASDLNPARLNKAEQLGTGIGAGGRRIIAVDCGDSDSGEKLRRLAPGGFDLIVDCTGSPQAVEAALPRLRNSGRLLIFGVCPQDSRVSINPYDVYRRDIAIFGSFALNRTAMQRAVTMLERGQIDPGAVIARTMPRSELEAALRLIKGGEVDGKIIIVPDLPS